MNSFHSRNVGNIVIRDGDVGVVRVGWVQEEEETPRAPVSVGLQRGFVQLLCESDNGSKVTNSLLQHVRCGLYQMRCYLGPI